jgi:hypothetical protein
MNSRNNAIRMMMNRYDVYPEEDVVVFPAALIRVSMEGHPSG